MMAARKAQQLRLLVADRDEPLVAQRVDGNGGSMPVPFVRVVIQSAGVVKEGEERHDAPARAGLLGEARSVQSLPRPVCGAVDAAPVERKVRADAGDQGRGRCEGLSFRRLAKEYWDRIGFWYIVSIPDP